VRAIVEDSPGAPDVAVLESARKASRILLTEDRDFGQLVFANLASPGAAVVLIRCPERARARLPQSIVSMALEVGHKLEGHLSVWTPRRLRMRRRQGE